MIDDGSSVQKSLQDIAQLLLYIHDDYLSTLEQAEDIQESLCLRVRDAGLSMHLTYLEIEAFRRKAMGPSSAPTLMDYELFYSWLKDVSFFVFRWDHLLGGRKSLHSILTRHVIPFASCS